MLSSTLPHGIVPPVGFFASHLDCKNTQLCVFKKVKEKEVKETVQATLYTRSTNDEPWEKKCSFLPSQIFVKLSPNAGPVCISSFNCEELSSDLLSSKRLLGSRVTLLSRSFEGWPMPPRLYIQDIQNIQDIQTSEETTPNPFDLAFQNRDLNKENIGNFF